MMPIAVAVVILALLEGCARPAASLSAERLVKLDALTDTCGLSRTVFDLRGTGVIRFRPAPETPYASVDCALSRLKTTGIPMKMGFVGNVAPSESDQ